MDVDTVVKDLGLNRGRLVFTESSYKFDASPHWETRLLWLQLLLR